MPRARIERNEPLRWIGLGAWWCSCWRSPALSDRLARIGRPLRELTRAAAADRRRATPPPPVHESGPSEIRTLSHSVQPDGRRPAARRRRARLLLAGVSHDLRTPLSRIRLGLEMLDDRRRCRSSRRAWCRTSRTSTPRSASSSISRGSAEAENVAPAADLNALVGNVCGTLPRARAGRSRSRARRCRRCRCARSPMQRLLVQPRRQRAAPRQRHGGRS